MHEVVLHYYDLSQGIAKQMSVQLVGKYFEGVWHTGICVYNKEYYYGGGISYDRVGMTPFGKPTKSKSLGFTDLPEDLFMEFLRENQREWSQDKYHVFEHNCNHFTNAASEFLLGEGIPKDIIEQPIEFQSTPLGQMLAPMMQQAQDGLKVQSNTVFNNQTGGTNPVEHAPNQNALRGGNPTQAQRPTGGMPPNLGALAGNPQLQNMMAGMNPQMMNQLMQRFGGMGGMGGLGGMGGMGGMQGMQGMGQQTGSSEPKLGEVLQISSLPQLQKLIKETPGVIVDFWNPGCGPCMRIKPLFESAAKSNENENLVFAAVNTQVAQSAAQAYGVNAIPNFIAFLNGNQIVNFKGADQQKLFQTIAQLSEQIPQGKVVNASKHDKLPFKQFKPSHMAPQGFTAQTNMDKMKQFIEKFVDSESVKKEVGEIETFKKWLGCFELEAIPSKAIDELIELLNAAEDKSKIALMDLIRLLLTFEHSAAHILHKHWETFEISIFQYLLCFDQNDPENKVMHNYHLVSLKMLGNLYQSQSGLDFVQDTEISKQIIQFCEYSIASSNSKTVFTASVVLFNHLLTYKRNFEIISVPTNQVLQKILEVLGNVQDATKADKDALLAMVLAEVRILFKNQPMLDKLASKKDHFIKVHKDLQAKVADSNVKQAIDDLLLLIGV